MATGLATSAATMLAAVCAKFARGAATIGAAIADFVGQVIKEVPPALRLLGGLGLCAIASIVGSVVLDNTLGKSCAVVFAPGFALAFGVVAHRWYDDLRAAGRPHGVQPAGHSGADPESSVAYADAKLALALSAWETEQHQQAMIALIQAKTATELALGSHSDEGPRPLARTRISEGSSAPEHS